LADRNAAEASKKDKPTHSTVKLAGVDLAWQSKKNPTAIAVGILKDSHLNITEIHQGLFSIESVIDCLGALGDLKGVAIDAPLVIKNQSGQRLCERELGREYSSRHASCHTSNLKLYPQADSVRLSNHLFNAGFQHLGEVTTKWQIECYPHPAIIEIFELSERLKYKKGKVAAKREGQKVLASLIKSLATSRDLALHIPQEIQPIVENQRIDSLKGKALKHNEDVLDSILCLYVAALYQQSHQHLVFGDTSEGYIYVPTFSC